MTVKSIRRSVRARIHEFADTLPVDSAGDWQIVNKHATAWLVSQQPTPAALCLTPDRRVRTLRWLGGLAAGVTTVGGAITLLLLTIITGPAAATPTLPRPLNFVHGTRSAAVTLLDRAVRLESSAVTNGTGSVVYAQTQNYALQTDVAHHASTTTVETTIRDVWVAANGAGIAKTALQDTTRNGTPVGRPQQQTTSDWQDDNVTLPTGLPALRATLLRPNGSGSSSEADLILGQQITSHLVQGTTTPAQTASLYRLLADMPTVFDAGVVTDGAGRLGDAIGVLVGHFDAGRTCAAVSKQSSSVGATLSTMHDLGNSITYLVLDPTTGRPQMVESLYTPNPPCGLGLPAGATIEQYSLILKTGRVTALAAGVHQR